MLVCLEDVEGVDYKEETGEEVLLVASPGHVPVLDMVQCMVEEEGEESEEQVVEREGEGHLLAALSYWCQGKPGGCQIDSSLTSCGSTRVKWHEEEDYNSREIPCPSYRHGALEKKFSKCLLGKRLLRTILPPVPLENTCFIKTVVRGSWQAARSQCWD